MKLNKIWIASVIRYNFGDPFSSRSKTFDHDPTEQDLYDFLEECNKEEPNYKNYETKIQVKTSYEVTN